MEDSIFTQIVKGKIPAQKIYEDELTLAFLDINPMTKGHTLVIPKQQIDHLDDCPPELYEAIFKTVHKVSKQLKNKLSPQRIGLIVHGYDVPHAHVHVLPIYRQGEVKFPGQPPASPNFEALASLAQQVSFSG